MHERVVDGSASSCRTLSESGIGDVCGCWAGKGVCRCLAGKAHVECCLHKSIHAQISNPFGWQCWPIPDQALDQN